jgi:DnaJ like chaperone protein
MGIGEIIAVLILGIVLYAVFSMRKKTGTKDNQESRHKPAGGGANPGRTENQPGDRKPRTGGYAKWVGGGLGWVFGGPIGAILGVALGSMFDGMNSGQYAYRGTPRGDFSMSLLVLSAAVMKADQRVLKSELEYVRSFFARQFGEDEGNRLIRMLQEILKQEINVREVSVQVGQFTDYPVKLQLVNYLFGIAAADNQYHPDEVEMISVIAGYMGVSSADFTSIRAMFVKSTGWAFEVLEITSEATDDEVKKAYREMAKKHHPDKVAHLGDDIRKSATEKFQKISAAYEEIKKQRGMN